MDGCLVDHIGCDPRNNKWLPYRLRIWISRVSIMTRWQEQVYTMPTCGSGCIILYGPFIDIFIFMKLCLHSTKE